MEKYITGTGQEIMVHEKSNCEGHHCVIHNPSNHHMKDWPTNWRQDRYLMERICPCGVGHPDPDDLAFKKTLNLPRELFQAESIHGCCGCCDPTIYKKKYKGLSYPKKSN